MFVFVFVFHRWDDSTIAVVTGANKGIGYEIAKQLGRQGLHVVVTSRDEGRGQVALKELQQAEPSAIFTYHQADITERASVQECAKKLKERFGIVHVLVNNAGIAYKGNVFGADEAQKTIACNLSGTRSMTEAVLPLMTKGARIINVCSECALSFFESVAVCFTHRSGAATNVCCRADEDTVVLQA